MHQTVEVQHNSYLCYYPGTCLGKDDAILLNGVNDNPELPLDPLVLLGLVCHGEDIGVHGPLGYETADGPAGVFVNEGRERVPQVLGVGGGDSDYLAGAPVHDLGVDEALGEEDVEQERAHVHVRALLPRLAIRVLLELAARPPRPRRAHHEGPPIGSGWRREREPWREGGAVLGDGGGPREGRRPGKGEKGLARGEGGRGGVDGGHTSVGRSRTNEQIGRAHV